MMSKIKEKFKMIILGKLKGLFSEFVHQYQMDALSRVRMMQGVFIHDNFVLGDGSGFEIIGSNVKIHIEENVLCRKYCNFLVQEGGSLIIHENVHFNNYSSINCLERIEIGADTYIGEGVKIYDHNHVHFFDDEGHLKVEKSHFTYKPVAIGQNSWIMSNVTILPGVEIGDNVIIGANNLIYKSIPSNSIIKAQIGQLMVNNHSKAKRFEKD